MAQQYLLGVDLGSGAVKLTLLSRDGQVIATATKEYPTYYPQVAWSEQDPEDWYRTFKITFQEILAKSGISPHDILALAPDAATHTAVLMDENFTPLRRAILWTDQRSRVQTEFLAQEYDELIFKTTYHHPDTMWTLPQNLWVRAHEPEVWKNTKRILFAKDYLRYRLTGEYVTDWIEALGSMFFDAAAKEWSERLCDLMEFPVENLPRVVAPTDIIERVSTQAARETGLAEGTVVVAGASDTSLEVFAAGAVRLGQATVKLATAGRICVVTDQAYPHPFLVNYYHVIPGRWYPGTGTRSCAASYRWYRDTFGDYENFQAEKVGKSSYHLLDGAAAGIPVGAEGLFFHPYLLGEFTPYSDSYLRGSFTGFSMKHTKAHFTRAVLEGVAFSLRDCLTVIRSLNMEMKEVRIIGGGAQSPLWRQIVADVLGLKVAKAVIDDSSFGAAMLAGVGTGVFSGFEEASDHCVSLKQVIEPNFANHEKYERLFALYQEIHDGLAPVYPKIAAEVEN
jgi:xylulokinase